MKYFISISIINLGTSAIIDVIDTVVCLTDDYGPRGALNAAKAHAFDGWNAWADNRKKLEDIKFNYVIQTVAFNNIQ